MRAPILLSALALHAPAAASEGPPKTDNGIVALDLGTGRELWSHKPAKLSDARFELYPEGLIVFPTRDPDASEHPLHLAPDTGKVLPAFEASAEKRIAASGTRPWLDKTRLGNGWVYLGCELRDRRGGSCTVALGPAELASLDLNGRMEAAPWRIVCQKPDAVLCWKDLVLVASEWGVQVRAFRVGAEQPEWMLDLNQLFPGRERPLRHLNAQLCGELLLVQSMENVLGVDPASGKILWKRDVAKDLGAPFYGGVMQLNVATAAFAREGDLLVIAYENRVMALDMKAQKYLWTMRPDTYPQRPLPVAHDGVVYLSAGDRRKVEAPPR